ncbi:MAG: hypothetical protein ACPLKQ_08070 [Candidatus Bathyarchaeales archaeon]
MVRMKISVTASIIALLLSALVITVSFDRVNAATNVRGIINSDTTWTKSNSPYNLTGNILVDSGVTLTIEAGAVVNFNCYYMRVNGSLEIQPGVILNFKSAVGIQVNGVMTARGTRNNPIHVNGIAYYYAWITPASYSSIVFSQASAKWNEQTGSGCIMENVILNSTAIEIHGSPRISSNTFVNNSRITVYGGSPIISKNTINGRISINGGSPIISNNCIKHGQIFYYSDQFEDNVTVIGNVISGSSEGIWFLGGSVGGHALIERNLIANNDVGIRIFNPNTDDLKTLLTIRKNTIVNNTVGIQLENRYSPTIINNNIYNNSANIKLSGSASKDINVTYNWWGTTETQSISQSIIDFEEDFNLGKVVYVPFLASPNAEAPAATYIPPADSPTPPPSQEPPSNQESPQTGSVETNLALALILTVVCASLGVLIYFVKKRNSNKKYASS